MYMVNDTWAILNCEILNYRSFCKSNKHLRWKQYPVINHGGLLGNHQNSPCLIAQHPGPNRSVSLQNDSQMKLSLIFR